jgi:DHA1 family multidrug resistance protein-like MFS transporter
MGGRSVTLNSANDRERVVSWKRNLYAITLAQAMAIIAFSLREPILPFFLKDLGADSTEAATRWSGLVASVGGFTMAITAPIWGIIGDRHGRKPMLLRSMIAASITIFLMGFATAPWHIVGLRLVEGAFTGTVTAATALVATSAPRDRLGYNLGMVQTAVFAGAALGPALGGIAASQIGYRPVFYLASFMMILATLVVIFFVQEIFTKPLPQPKSNKPRREKWSWMMTGIMVSMLATLFAVRFVGQGIRPIMPLYIQDLGDFSNSEAAAVSGWMFAVLGVTSAVSSIVLGKRGDRVGHRNILIACVFGAGLLYVPMAFATHPWQLIVLQGLFGVAAGGMIPAANTIIANATPAEHRGFTFGITNTAGSIGSAFGPLILSSMIAPTLGFPAAFLTVGVLMTMLAAWLWWNTGRVPETTHQAVALSSVGPGVGGR